MRKLATLVILAACALLAGARANAPLNPEPAPRPPTSLCRAGEQVLFSCKVADGPKFVSVCGSNRLDAKRGYVQYRFGRVGALELEYPQGLEETQRAFRYAHYFRAQVDRTELSFERGGYKYALYDYYEGDVRPVIAEAGVRVTRPGGEGEAVEIKCRGRATSRLGLLSDVVPVEEGGELGPGGEGGRHE